MSFDQAMKRKNNIHFSNLEFKSNLNLFSFVANNECHCLDFSDGQFLKAMRCRCFFYNNDAMSMFLAISYHRNRCDYFCSTIGTDCFPMFFSIRDKLCVCQSSGGKKEKNS